MAETCKEVQISNLSEKQKGNLLAEMRRNIRSKLDRMRASLEADARKTARKVSGSKEFKGFRSQIQDLMDARKETIEQLGDAFKAEDKVFAKEQKMLNKEHEKAIAKLQKSFNKSWTVVAKKRNKLGERSNKKMVSVRSKANASIKRVQHKMQDKFGDKLISVDFSTPKGSLRVQPVTLYRDEVRGLVSSHTEIMNAVEKWNSFRVEVFAHPDFVETQKKFDKLVQNL